MARSFGLATSFGILGFVLGIMVSERNLSSYALAVQVACGGLFALIGATIGAAGDIVAAIQRAQDRQEPSRRQQNGSGRAARYGCGSEIAPAILPTTWSGFEVNQ
jgi:hypothetical protein